MTDKVYSARYRAKQKLYRRKVKPAKIDNPMAIPSMENSLVVKTHQRDALRAELRKWRDGDGDGFRTNPATKKDDLPVPSAPSSVRAVRGPSGRRIPPPPVVQETEQKPERRPAPPVRDVLRRVGYDELEWGKYDSNPKGAGPHPGDIIMADVYYVDQGQVKKKNRPVLIIGTVRDQPGVLAALEITSQPKGDRDGYILAHDWGQRDDKGQKKHGWMSLRRVVEIHPKDRGAGRVAHVPPKHWERAATELGEYRTKQQAAGEIVKGLHRSSLRKALFGGLKNAGKGYAADKMRGGLRIAQAMTAAERSARSKAGWKNRKRAAPRMPGVGGGHRGAGMKPKGGFDRFYSSPLGSMRSAASESKRDKLRSRLAGQYKSKPEFRTGRSALDDVMSNPLGAYRGEKKVKAKNKKERKFFSTSDKIRRAKSRVSQAEYADRRDERKYELRRGEADRHAEAIRRQKAIRDRRSERRKELRNAQAEAKKKADAAEMKRRQKEEKKADRKEKVGRLREVALAAGKETKVGQTLSQIQEGRKQEMERRKERKQAFRDLRDYIKTGDDSIIDRWEPEGMREKELAGVEQRFEAREKKRKELLALEQRDEAAAKARKEEADKAKQRSESDTLSERLTMRELEREQGPVGSEQYREYMRRQDEEYDAQSETIRRQESRNKQAVYSGLRQARMKQIEQEKKDKEDREKASLEAEKAKILEAEKRKAEKKRLRQQVLEETPEFKAKQEAKAAKEAEKAKKEAEKAEKAKAAAERRAQAEERAARSMAMKEERHAAAMEREKALLERAKNGPAPKAPKAEAAPTKKAPAKKPAPKPKTAPVASTKPPTKKGKPSLATTTVADRAKQRRDSKKVTKADDEQHRDVLRNYALAVHEL